jgi:HEAT repeat protein
MEEMKKMKTLTASERCTLSERLSLLRMLADADPRVRRAATNRLGKVTAAPRHLGNEAITRVGDENRIVVNCPGRSNVGFVADEAVSALVAALEDDQWQVRVTGAWALGELGREAEAAVPALSLATSDRSWLVRGVSKHSLRRIRQGDEQS